MNSQNLILLLNRLVPMFSSTLTDEVQAVSLYIATFVTALYYSYQEQLYQLKRPCLSVAVAEVGYEVHTFN